MMQKIKNGKKVGPDDIPLDTSPFNMILDEKDAGPMERKYLGTFA